MSHQQPRMPSSGHPGESETVAETSEQQAQENFNLSQIFESEQTQSAALIHWDGEAQYATAGGSSSQTGQQQSQYSYQVALAGLYSVDYAAQLPPSEFAGPYDRYFSYAFGAEFGYPLVAPERLPDNRLYLPVSHSLPPLPSSGLANEHPISSLQDLNLDFDLFTPGFDSPLNPFDAFHPLPPLPGPSRDPTAPNSVPPLHLPTAPETNVPDANKPQVALSRLSEPLNVASRPKGQKRKNKGKGKAHADLPPPMDVSLRHPVATGDDPDALLHCPFPNCPLTFYKTEASEHLSNAHKDCLRPAGSIISCPISACALTRVGRTLKKGNFSKHFIAHLPKYRCPWGCPQRLARDEHHCRARHAEVCCVLKAARAAGSAGAPRHDAQEIAPTGEAPQQHGLPDAAPDPAGMHVFQAAPQVLPAPPARRGRSARPSSADAGPSRAGSSSTAQAPASPVFGWSPAQLQHMTYSWQAGPVAGPSRLAPADPAPQLPPAYPRMFDLALHAGSLPPAPPAPAAYWASIPIRRGARLAQPVAGLHLQSTPLPAIPEDEVADVPIRQSTRRPVRTAASQLAAQVQDASAEPQPALRPASRTRRERAADQSVPVLQTDSVERTATDRPGPSAKGKGKGKGRKAEKPVTTSATGSQKGIALDFSTDKGKRPAASRPDSRAETVVSTAPPSPAPTNGPRRSLRILSLSRSNSTNDPAVAFGAMQAMLPGIAQPGASVTRTLKRTRTEDLENNPELEPSAPKKSRKLKA